MVKQASGICSDLAVGSQASVTLAAPLAGRTLRDAATGKPVKYVQATK
jgi:hypothetical protein